MKRHLVENEINKMKSLIGYNIGDIISEQEQGDCPAGLVKVKTQCCLPKENKITKGAPKIGKLVKNAGGYSLYGLGEFPSGVDKNPTIVKEFISSLQSAIDSSEIDTEKFNVNIAVAQINSSASNDMNGPVKAGRANVHHRNPKAAGYTHKEDDSFFSGDQKKNEKLAADRGANLWVAMQKELSGTDSKIKIIMDPAKNGGKPSFNSWITDTGGCIDSRRDIKKYRNPGQIVTMRVILELVDKAAEEERQCLTGMKVIVGYYAPPEAFDRILKPLGKALSNKKITQEEYDANLKSVEIEKSRSLKLNKGRVSINTKGTPGGHACNNARFAIYMNDIKIGPRGALGVVNLNNAGGNTDPGNPIGKIKVEGGSREGSVIVNARQALLIANKKVDAGEAGSVIISIKGLTKNSHNDVPWITIITGQGKVLMNKQADQVEGYNAARGKTGLQKLFGPFNPCEVIS